MEVTAHYRGRSRFEISARDHRLISDQPLDNNGADSGMTPPELLLAAMASCVGYYAARYLEARNLASSALEVRVAAEKASNPARLGSFRVDITAPELDERHRTGVLRAARSCLIHNTLSIPPAIEICLNGDIRVDGQAPDGADGHATLETKATSSIGPAA